MTLTLRRKNWQGLRPNFSSRAIAEQYIPKCHQQQGLYVEIENERNNRAGVKMPKDTSFEAVENSFDGTSMPAAFHSASLCKRKARASDRMEAIVPFVIPYAAAQNSQQTGPMPSTVKCSITFVGSDDESVIALEASDLQNAADSL
eukprot:5529961-Pleurochrysis_carterae.AAC.1